MIPHQPKDSLISISVAEARQYGLAEATLLSQLRAASSWLPVGYFQGIAWHEINTGKLLDSLPFNGLPEFSAALNALAQQGAVQVTGIPQSAQAPLQFSLASQPQTHQHSTQSVPVVSMPSHTQGNGLMTAHWKPTDETLGRIQQLGVPAAFSMQQLPEFITFWRNSGEQNRSWDAKFHQHVIRKWRDHETFLAGKQKQTIMFKGWRPSEDAVEVLTQQSRIPANFIEDAIPEFILYWTEKGTPSDTWNKVFCTHVQHQWARYKSAVKNDTQPTRIDKNWQPDPDTYDILRMANIDVAFAQQLIPEFVLFWRETNQLQRSWNTKFLQHVKFHWAKRHSLNPSASSNQYAGATQPNRRTRDVPLEERLKDRSWAT